MEDVTFHWLDRQYRGTCLEYLSDDSLLHAYIASSDCYVDELRFRRSDWVYLHFNSLLLSLCSCLLSRISRRAAVDSMLYNTLCHMMTFISTSLDYCDILRFPLTSQVEPYLTATIRRLVLQVLLISFGLASIVCYLHKPCRQHLCTIGR